MFEQANAGWLEAAKTPIAAIATRMTTTPATSAVRYRWRNDCSGLGRRRSRRPARVVPLGLLLTCGDAPPLWVWSAEPDPVVPVVDDVAARCRRRDSLLTLCLVAVVAVARGYRLGA
jgi:hypothetical protein